MKKEIIKIIVVAFVLTIILSTISLGKYFNKTKINVNSGVAIPIIKLEGEQKLIINNNQENKVYNLAVKNYDENEQITQVELEYYIEIISKKNDDINFKIYKEEKELNINNNKTEKFLLTKENKQRDNYKIEILLNKKISELKYKYPNVRTFLEEKEPIELRDDEQYAMLNVLDYETELDVIELKESFKLGFKEALIYLNNMGMLKLN